MNKLYESFKNKYIFEYKSIGQTVFGRDIFSIGFSSSSIFINLHIIINGIIDITGALSNRETNNPKIIFIG